MSLYKYLGPERIDVLESGRIIVTPPTKRNDPFDELPALGFDFSEARLRQEFKERHLEGRGWNSEDDYVRAMQADSCRLLSDAAHKQRAKQGAQFGAICLSRVWDSIPMWSYYAKEHSGLVIEFDDSAPAFRERFDVPIPITYGNRPLIIEGQKIKNFDLVAVKAPAWTHEQEMRIWRALDENERTVKNGETVYLTEYPRETITRVFIGCCATTELKEALRTNFRRWGFAHADLVALAPHHEHFAFVQQRLEID